MVSSSSRPGSRRWTCMSIRPGQTILPEASRTLSACRPPWPEAEDLVPFEPEIGDLIHALPASITRPLRRQRVFTATQDEAQDANARRRQPEHGGAYDARRRRQEASQGWCRNDPAVLTLQGQSDKKQREKPPSSSGLGHSPLTAKTGVRVPLGVIYRALREIARLCHFMAYAVKLQDRKSQPLEKCPILCPIFR